VVRVKVVSEPDHGPLTLRQSMLRLAGYVLSAIPFWWGYITAGWEPKKRGWHDFLAKTVSIRAALPLALAWFGGLAAPAADAAETDAPFTQIEASFLTSRPGAFGGEMAAALLYQPLTDRNLLFGPRLSVRGLSGSTGAIAGLQAGIEGNLWVANALGPGFAFDFVGPLGEGASWQPPGWRAQGFALARFKRYEKDGAWAGRVGVSYDSRYQWGFLAGVSLQFSGVPMAFPALLAD
jgi:hypothetical protein